FPFDEINSGVDFTGGGAVDQGGEGRTLLEENRRLDFGIAVRHHRMEDGTLAPESGNHPIERLKRIRAIRGERVEPGFREGPLVIDDEQDGTFPEGQLAIETTGCVGTV